MLFNSDNIVAEKNDISFFEAGIVDDVKLETIERKTTPNGKNLIELTFTKGGSKLTSSEWEPEKFADEKEEDFERRCSGYLSRLIDILACFYDRSSLTVKADSFSDLADWFVMKAQSADKTHLVRIKSVYNKNGYIVLAGGYKYTFIEPMTVKKEDTKIRILSKDVIVRPEKDVDEIKDIKTDNATEKENLPF